MASFIDYDTASIHSNAPPVRKELQRSVEKPAIEKPVEKSVERPVIPPEQEVSKPSELEKSVIENIVPEEQIVAEITKPKPAKKPRTRKKQTESNTDVVYLRNFPVSLVLEAKRLFPSASSQTDAVAALLAVKTGVVDGLSESVLALISMYKEKDEAVISLKNIDMRLSHLESKARDTERLLQELEVASMYSIFDYLGYRKVDVPANPRNMDFLEPGLQDIIYRMREQSAEFAKDEKLKDGRPIR